jgi:cysteine desulfurase
VLIALGRSRQEAAASVRFGLGRSTTEEQIKETMSFINQLLAKLR